MLTTNNIIIADNTVSRIPYFIVKSVFVVHAYTVRVIKIPNLKINIPNVIKAAIITIYPPDSFATAEQMKLMEYDSHSVNARRRKLFTGNDFPNEVQMISISMINMAMMLSQRRAG
jgi:hypothetical protein